MAIQKLDKQEQLDLTTNWDGTTGQQVEDLISRHLPASMEYNSSDNMLTITNSEGGTIVQTEVSVAQPEYNHSIQIQGIYFNNIGPEGNQIDKDAILCKLGTKIYLGVKYTYTAINPLTNNVTHVNSTQKLYINIGSGFVQLEQGIKSSADIQYIEITNLYNKVTSSNVSVRAISSANIEDKIVTATTSKKVQVVDPKLRYSGSTYVVSGTAGFEVQDGGGASYLLYYKINNDLVFKNQDNLILALADTGVNKIEAYVAVANNASIQSEPLKVQVINTKGVTSFDKVLYAINEITTGVNNWEFSKLYKLSIYFKKQSQEESTIVTKLTETGNSEDYKLNKTKTITLTGDNGVIEQDISYFLGITAAQETFSTVLVVNIDGEDIISWDTPTIIKVSNEGSFSYTSDCSYYFDQYAPDNSNIITKEVINKTISPDGLITDDTLSVFRLSAGNYPNNIINLNLSDQLTTQGFTFELDFKSYNISDETKPLLKLGRFILYPTELNWQYGSVDTSKVDTTAKSSIFQGDTRTHILIEIVPNFKAPAREVPVEVKKIANKTTNLVRVFINGGVDRLYKYDYLTDFNYDGFNLQINPESADLDIYGIRVYNRALTLKEVENNYVSTMSSVTEKSKFQQLNDLVATDANNDTYISYNKVKSLYNTLVYIMPNTHRYPNQFNLVKGVSIDNCTVFINYVNSVATEENHILSEAQINRCSGRFTKATISGQGTSAMKYYWYNIQMKNPIFTSQGCYNEELDEYVEPTDSNPNNYQYNSEYYYMPEDKDCTIGIKKSCGKFNYASSMQSHKIGAVKAFHDLWDACVDKAGFTTDEIKGRKACLEDTFIAFYVETDLQDVSNYKLSDLAQLDDSKIMFAGFQTWGSAKGDKNTFGYSKTTPGYLLLEGAENNGELCNWLAPWSPSVVELSGETWKTKQLIVNEGAISYGLSDSFDVDFGLDSSDDKGNTMSADGQQTLNKFIEAYNFVYMHTINLLPYKETYSLNDPRNSTLDITKKYYITSINYQDNTYFRGAQWDVFRYDRYSNLWVPAGLPVLNNDGSQKLSTVRSAHNTDVYEYETFNLKKFHEQLETSGVENINTYITDLKTDFKNKFGTYFHVDDIIYHQAFIRLFAGTDNRAKNTYFKLFNKDCKIQLLQDDLDTILATDNRGLQKKPYFLLEPSLESDKTYKQMWGGSSAFFELVDITYKEEIDAMLLKMLKQMSFGSTESSLDTWMTKYFYYVQKYYPAVTYNYVSRLAYECAQIFFDNQKEAGVTWTNNGQTPVSQEHGSCLESEIAFMRKRLTMFLSQARIATFGRDGAGIPIKVKEDTQDPQSYSVRITPYQYLYLGYLVGSVSNLYTPNRISAGETTKITISLASNDASYYVLGGNYIQRFDNFSQVIFSQGDYSLSAPKLLEFSVNTGSDALPLFQPPSLTLKCDVLEKLDLTNVRSLTTINLDSKHTPKLKEVILTGTNISNVTLPPGSRLTKIHYPASLTSLVITDNEGLQEVRFESLNNLETVNINCAKVGQFDIANFCEQLVSCPSLKSVTLKNLNSNISLNVLEKLILLKATLTGKLKIVNSDNESEAISYTDKINLVNLYGNIDSESNKLYINYKEIIAYNISCEAEVSVYGEGYSGNPFGLSLDGNNVALVTEEGKVIPDITYSFNSDVSDVATINKRTGIITLKTASSTKDTTATITVNLTKGNPLSKTVKVYFAWRAPELGNFVYADGTYSNAYMTNKTLMGLIFAIDRTNDTSGKAYIVGKEYLDPQYVGYSNEGNEGAIDDRKNLFNVRFWLKNHVPGVEDTYYLNKNVNSYIDNKGSITSEFTQKMPSTFTGKSDTQAYINNVNTILLPILVKTYPELIQYSDGIGSITTKENLNTLLTKIPNINNQNLEQMQCLLFPYFYETYLYEPTVTEEEKNTTAFSTYFSKGNWYVPSYSELATLIYYRGYSAVGENFSTGDIPIKYSISDSVPKKQGDLKNPIFSIAYKNAGNYMPTAWNTLADSNNLCTTTDSTCHNYTYQEISSYSGGWRYDYQWVLGTNDGNTGTGINAAQYKGWRLIKHKPLPCVQFDYQKK